jgi:thioesterase domain-containing protein
LYLHALACHLGTDQPVYGLETPGLHGECPMPNSVEQHAALLLQAIRKQQPNGPYRLAGHSAGGLVALALAHQLENQGEKIQCLIILDATAPQINLESTAELTEVEALWSVVKIIEELKNTQIDLTEAEIAAESDRPNYQINCPVILVKAKEIPNEIERPNSLDWGWQLYSTQTIQIIETSGGHITMLTQPYVAELALLLNVSSM